MAILNRDKQFVYETIKLQVDEEYRIYLKPHEWIRIWMVHGSAEVFGTELREAKRNEKYGQTYPQYHSRHKRSKHKKQSIDEIKSNPNDKEEMYLLRDSYLFSNTNISIYSYQGATLYIKFPKGQCEHKFKTSDVCLKHRNLFSLSDWFVYFALETTLKSDDNVLSLHSIPILYLAPNCDVFAFYFILFYCI